jgi:hypothetical protein
MQTFLELLFLEGRICFDAPPHAVDKLTPPVQRTLQNAFDRDLLSLAGPTLPLNASLALTAANLVQQAAWLLVNRTEASEQAAKRLPHVPTATSASDLASVDLLLRYIPHLYQRAVALSAEDVLTIHIKTTMLAWPLSGVLAELPEHPTGALNFFGHRGLQLRYAERLALRPRAGWRPADPASLDAVSLVFEQQGLSLDLLNVITVPTDAVPEDNHE